MAMELTEVSVVSVVKTLWPLPLLQSVCVEAERGRGLTVAMELTEMSVVTEVETLWPLPLLLSVCNEAE